MKFLLIFCCLFIYSNNILVNNYIGNQSDVSYAYIIFTINFVIYWLYLVKEKFFLIITLCMII